MRKAALLLPLVLLIASCAQILSPDGGPKDSEAPEVTRYLPDSAATNFTGNRIVIRFNEYVTLSDVDNQLIVSPPLKERPEVSVRKKEIVIKLKDSLQPNTTYTISFGNAIRDITEGNIKDNFRYVFSTGPVIDSLEFSGKVVNASTLDGEKGMLVMLYKTTGDSAPLKQKPYYFTKTKADGSFLLTNLQAGTYKVFALDDKNQDYLYNNTEERIAFPDELLQLDTNVTGVTLRMFQEQPPKQSRMKSAQPVPGHISLVYSLPLKDPKVDFIPALPEEMNAFIEKSVTGDSLDIWFSEVTRDSVKVNVTDANGFSDTLKLHLSKPEPGKKARRGGDARKLTLSANVQKGQTFESGKMLSVITNNPVREWNAGSFVLLRGNDTVKTTLTLAENKRNLIFGNKLDEDSTYTLYVPPGAITDWFGQKSDTLKVKFNIQSANSYGKLTVKTSSLPAGHYLLQVLSEKNQLLRQVSISGSQAIDFEKMPGGQFRLKLIDDANGNGKWDTGNYLQRRQPEKVIFYATPVRMRAGWDMEVEWVFQ